MERPADQTIVPACTCPKTGCERYLQCDACIAYHSAKDTLAHCFRPPRPEPGAAPAGSAR